ncbi:uncharacterized protein LOC143146918 [Ptiloglossa arizonensis]|uniref:uncharacterized protein LOC143146918 n=1 Tax=Ptiloglossa arizonensis TaxID=3350558 RepID=UPI003FA05B25
MCVNSTGQSESTLKFATTNLGATKSLENSLHGESNAHRYAPCPLLIPFSLSLPRRIVSALSIRYRPHLPSLFVDGSISPRSSGERRLRGWRAFSPGVTFPSTEINAAKCVSLASRSLAHPPWLLLAERRRGVSFPRAVTPADTKIEVCRRGCRRTSLSSARVANGEPRLVRRPVFARDSAPSGEPKGATWCSQQSSEEFDGSPGWKEQGNREIAGSSSHRTKGERRTIDASEIDVIGDIRARVEDSFPTRKYRFSTVDIQQRYLLTS